jgi:ferredoxin/flavodoxin---NADP+ reductase
MSTYRAAVVGAGPAGLYTAQLLLSGRPDLRVDLYEKDPTPWGLVRFGVAPDHQNIKSVTRVFERVLAHERFRFIGNVQVGLHISRADLLSAYDVVVYATGAQSERDPAITGLNIDGVWSARAFVGWYNGAPEFAALPVRTDADGAVVIGIGNVALDVARLLIAGPDHFALTDVADHALAALRVSGIQRVTIVGRRGVEAARFSAAELTDLVSLPGVSVCARSHGSDVRDLHGPGAEALAAQILRKAAARSGGVQGVRELRFEFGYVPVGFAGNGTLTGLVTRSAVTGEERTVAAGLAVYATGYRGTALMDLPFDEGAGVIANEGGKVLGSGSEFVAGWIKRGPSGVIGDNKRCAAETVRRVLEYLGTDVTADRHRGLGEADLAGQLREAGRQVVDVRAWRNIDQAELSAGSAQNRPRVKLVSTDELLQAAQGRRSL